MAAAIALDKPKQPTHADAQNAGSAARPNLSLPRSNSPFAALLAKAQAPGSRRTGASRTPPDTPGRSDATKTEPGRTAGALQRPSAPNGTPTDPANTTKENPADKDAGTTSARKAAGTPAKPHAATIGPTASSEQNAGSVTSSPAPTLLLPAAAEPALGQNAAADASTQASDNTADPSLGEQSVTPALPSLEADPGQTDEADPSADVDVAPAGSLARSNTKPIPPTALPVSGQDANTSAGTLLLNTTPLDSGVAPASPPVVPHSADVAPDVSEWADAREAVAVRMAHAVQEGVQNVSIDLHPAELGHVGIELSFHAGGVSVQMTLSRQETFNTFSRDRAAMEQQLAQSGINLGSGGLDLRFDQKRNQPQAFSATSTAAPITSVQQAAAAHPAAPPRAANSHLNIIA